MASLIVSAIVLGLAIWTNLVACSRPADAPIDDMASRYDQWLARHNKQYNDADKEKRFVIFKNNVEFIDLFNSDTNKTYKLAVNAFADRTNEEFLATHTGYMKAPAGFGRMTALNYFKYENVTDVPESVDWREQGAVTPVKNQGGYCGDCWAFSAIGAVEGIHKLSTGTLISLSEQQLLDCNNDTNHGCDGGYPQAAFDYIKDNGGITSEDNYPFLAEQGTCDLSEGRSPVAQIKGYGVVPPNSEDSLLKAVANQPVTVGIDSSMLQFYSSGVLTGECGTVISHSVLAVGYGTSPDGVKYWLVKNSWGAEWGMEGYVMIERGVAAPEGQCGIAMDSSYPIV